jgi:chorismate mutase
MRHPVIDLDIVPLAQWSGSGDQPLVIAGPCSAETETQMFEAARQLAAIGVEYLRAGVWKARTRPNNFDGIGDDALKWLSDAGREVGMKTATEVANARHVEKALEFGIDVLWIGARTTANPFSVQEIADALRGSDVPVLVKNPVNPDLALWIGAIERIHDAGIRKLCVVHRGFSTVDQTRFRNKPMWDLVIELRRMISNIPILNDPSHIAGRRDFVHGICQRAMDLGLDGILVEAHPDPENAWSDAAQQVTPERLGEILDHLKIRQPSSDDVVFNASLQQLRLEIDRIDAEVLEVLSLRSRIVDRIAECKKASNVTTLQVSRWKELLEDRMAKGESLGLGGEYVKTIYEIIHQESIRQQSEIMSAVKNGSEEPAQSPAT